MKGKQLDEKHYWLCDGCAKERGGAMEAGHQCTVIRGACPYCKMTTTLIPWVDFNWVNRELTKRAKMMRD